MTCHLLIGDVFDRMREIPDHSVDLILTSPPFLALRSYLPEDHPDKAKEIGSEASPAEYLDVLLELTAEWRRLLAPHGSIAVELGDTYAGSGGAGGDWSDSPATTKARVNGGSDGGPPRRDIGSGWPLDKSLTGIPTLYTWSLAYGRNLLTGQESPAGMWRIRNLKPWIRSNPPVGALGDKERPATSYITVACLARDRWFDLDAVRTVGARIGETPRITKDPERSDGWGRAAGPCIQNPAGAPPLDWNVDADLIIDNELARPYDNRASQDPATIGKGKLHGGEDGQRTSSGRSPDAGRRGVHIRRRLQQARILPAHPDALDISSKGYGGAHYAVWPPELCRLLIDEMCPRRVCVTCGQPSRRITETTNAVGIAAGRRSWREGGTDGVGAGHVGEITVKVSSAPTAERVTLGWSDCGHNTWRPGMILDPFAGSGTTLAVASGMGRDSIGIDIDETSADLAQERVGMFLEIDYGTRENTA